MRNCKLVYYKTGLYVRAFQWRKQELSFSHIWKYPLMICILYTVIEKFLFFISFVDLLYLWESCINMMIYQSSILSFGKLKNFWNVHIVPSNLWGAVWVDSIYSRTRSQHLWRYYARASFSHQDYMKKEEELHIDTILFGGSKKSLKELGCNLLHAKYIFLGVTDFIINFQG